MRHLGRFVIFIIASVNALFTLLLLLAAYSPYVQPAEHPVASCFGLTFPIFLFINVCFLIFWLICQQYKVALLPLLGLALSYQSIQAYIPLHFLEEDPPEGSIKLLSYNTMAFVGDVKKNGKNPVLTYLQESEADIICLQEYAVSLSKQHVTQRDVNKALKAYPYSRITQIGGAKDGGYANRLACYSRYPILSARTIPCESNYNGAVLYRIKVGEDTLSLINCHLESNKLTLEDKSTYEDMLKEPETEKVKSGAKLLVKKLAEASAIRAPQADSLVATVKRLNQGPVVVCGDFNDTPVSYSHRVLAQEMDDAFVQSGNGLGISYNRNYFYFRIDHIFINDYLQSYRCRVDRSIKDSDHYPVWCYLKMKN